MVKSVEVNALKAKNTIWSIVGDYKIPVDISFLEEDFFGYNRFYSTILLGGIFKYLNYGYIYKFHQNLKKTHDYEIIHTILGLALEQTVIYKLQDFILNITNIRKDSYRDLILKSRNQNYFEHELKNQYMKYILGEFPKLPPAMSKLFYFIISFKEVKDTNQFSEKFMELLKTYFHFEKTLVSEVKGILDKDKKSFDRQYNVIDVKNLKDSMSEFLSEFTSAEFSPNEYLLEVNYDMDSSLVDENQYKALNYEKQKQKIIGYYGNMIENEEKIKYLEKKYIKDIHLNHKIFITDGDMSKSDNEYRKDTLEEYKEANLSHFERNSLVYNYSINKLVRDLSELLLQENSNIDFASNGKLMANRVFRNMYLGSDKIFYKRENYNKKDIYVDLIVDASASLLEKQGQIASQIYVISEALTRVGIKNAITTYNNFLDFTIVKQLKTYDSKDTDRCFNYYCSGGNRDGLAISIINEYIKRDSNIRNVVFVFTDARPFDVQVLEKIGKKGIKPYEGKEAVEDSANAVRHMRLDSSKVVGIFNGKGKDLESQKYIYGNDFLNAQSITRLSDMVGDILISEIKDNFNL